MSGRLPTMAARSARVTPSTLRPVAQRQALAAPRPLLNNTTRNYAVYEGNPHPTGGRMAEEKRKSFLRRFLVWGVGGTALFYGGSTVVAVNNQAYGDWFSETFPFAEDLLEYLDTHDVVSEARRLDYAGVPSHTIDAIGNAYNRVGDAAKRIAGEGEEVAHDIKIQAQEAEKKARAKILEARDEAKRKVAKVSRKVEEETTPSKTEEAKEEAKGAIETIKNKTTELVDKTKAAVTDAEAEVEKDVKKGVRRVTEKQETTVKKPYPGHLPVSHEAPEEYVAPQSGDRKLKAESNANTRLRSDPESPKLPQLAPALSSLTGGEPMIGELAGTIDDLAAFVRDTPASSTGKAKYVLEEAKDELQRLSKRLDEIRKSEQARAERSLGEQARKFEADMKRKAEEQSKKYDQLDAEGKKKVEQERAKASSDYEKRLQKELETQREIINERLKEEVIAQGVEMQRRWMKEIKTRVEEERGGRLARLDQLASDLGEIEKVTMNNSAALEQGSGAHRASAAVRALIKAALQDPTLEQEAGYKQSFAKELQLLKSSPLTEKSDVIKAAIASIEGAASPSEGVESLSSLTSWYVQKLKPRLQSVALLPEQAGLLSHLTSAVLSPLLFTKAGNPPGDDVPSILARAEYALLQKGDLDTAARELNSLKGWGKVLAEDWLRESRKRLEVEQGLGVVQAEVAYQGLLNA